MGQQEIWEKIFWGFCSQYISRNSHGNVPKNSKQFWCSGEKTGSGGKLPPPPLATQGLSSDHVILATEVRNFILLEGCGH